jgi:mannonate dehydratase
MTQAPSSPSRRRFIAGGACCGLTAALAQFRRGDPAVLPLPPWPQDVQALWQRVWTGLDPAEVADLHVHLLGDGAPGPDDDRGAWIHPRTLQPWVFGDWVRRLAIEGASGVSGRPDLSAAYLERLAQCWAAFPAGARPLLLAFDAAFDDAGRLDADHTMFRTGNAYAAQAAATRGWGWIASVHPARADAIERLQAAHAAGALAVKWLPSAMNIDPASPRHRRYYAELARLGLPLLTHAGEEMAVTGAGAHELVNPLLLRRPLGEGVRVIVAHGATLGEALDLDHPRRPRVPAFALFSRLMDERAHAGLVHGDISAVTQINRSTADLRRLLEREDWHARLLHGSDYPLPGLGWLTSVRRLATAGLLDAADVAPLQALQGLNPLAFDFALKRCLRWQGRRFADGVFAFRSRLRAPAPR